MTRHTPLALCLLLAACVQEAPQNQFQGYVEGDYIHMAAPVGGWLETVSLTEGSMIVAGMPLFSLDSTAEQAALDEARAKLAQAEASLADLQIGQRPEEIAAMQAQLTEAEAALRLARRELERQQDLAKTNVASQSRLDEARSASAQAAARVERMRAELATARLPARSDRIMAAEATVAAARAAVSQAGYRLSQRQILSPVDALVDDIVRDAGEWVPANGVVVSLLPKAAIKLVFFVPEPQRMSVQPGQGVAVSCTGCPPGLSATISHLASQAEYTPPVIYSLETRAKLVYRAEATLPPDAVTLHPGQPVTVAVRR